MTGPTARVLALLEILQAGGTRTAADLAGRLGVDERTIRRDALHLTELGVAVRSVRGRYGGYRLEPGYRLPPLTLTDDEAVAVLLGLVAGRAAGWAVAPPAAVESAIAKLQRVLPKALSRRVTALLDSLDVTAPDPTAPPPHAALLLRLAGAARDGHPVEFGYTAADGRDSERTVEPYAIVAHHGRWYVTGSDVATRAIRSFRLDRVRDARVLDGSFTPPDDFDAAAHLVHGIARAPRAHAVSLRVRATAAEALARFPRALVTAEELGDGWTRVRLGAERLDWVPGVVVAAGFDVVVEEPPALRVLVHDVGVRLVAAAT